MKFNMENTEENESGHEDNSRPHIFWPVATTLALVAAGILGINAHRLSEDLSAQQTSTQAQFTRLSGQLAQASDQNKQLLESVAQEARNSATTAALANGKTTANLSAKLGAQLAQQRKAQLETQEHVTGELDQLQQASNSASSKLNEIGADVSGVRTDVDSTRSELQQTGSDLRRVTGDMGVVSDRVATNGKQLSELRALGEREYVEFDLKRTAGLQKVGGIQLGLAKADPKRNRFTLDVLADDKRAQKKDRTINEPVQLYVSGGHQPYEIVINEVKKDEVVGYLAIPKVKMARR
jgi:hypothetical protein